MRRYTTTAARMWDVYSGLMLNAQCYMSKNPVYFTSTATIRFPYGIKRLFDWTLSELQYLHEKHPHHFTLDLDQLDRILEYCYIKRGSFSITDVELKYMFDTLFFMSTS